MGFVVLTWDPFGQGERGVSSRDHRRDCALLACISGQGYAKYETRGALEYVRSRSEVDTERIGMTGASGGGYNTRVTTVLDDRIKVAVPVVRTSDSYEQIWSTRFRAWGNCVDHCHHVAGLVCYANNHEFLTCVVPRPLCMIAAHDDHNFPADGVKKIYEYGHGPYGSFGAPQKINAFVDITARHGYQIKKREAAYGSFLRWLMDEGTGRPLPEPPTDLLPPNSPEMCCFPVGKNQPAGPGMVQVANAAIKRLPVPAAPPDLEALFGKLPSSAPLAAAFRQPAGKSGRVQRLEFISENGITIRAFLVNQENAAFKGVIVGVDDRGKEELLQDHFIQSALRAGWAACGIDPCGIGELEVERIKWVSRASLLINENFVWCQGWDLRCALHCLRDAKVGAHKPLVSYRRGDSSALAVTYALIQKSSGQVSKARSFILRDGFLSYHQFIDRPESLALSYGPRPDMRNPYTAFDCEIPYRYFVFDVLRWTDLPQLMGSVEAQGLVVNPVDGDWKHISGATARKLLPPAIRLAGENHPEETMLHFLGG